MSDMAMKYGVPFPEPGERMLTAEELAWRARATAEQARADRVEADLAHARGVYATLADKLAEVERERDAALARLATAEAVVEAAREAFPLGQCYPTGYGILVMALRAHEARKSLDAYAASHHAHDAAKVKDSSRGCGHVPRPGTCGGCHATLDSGGSGVAASLTQAEPGTTRTATEAVSGRRDPLVVNATPEPAGDCLTRAELVAALTDASAYLLKLDNQGSSIDPWDVVDSVAEVLRKGAR